MAIAAACEDDRFSIRAFAKSENALSICRLVFKVLDHLPEAFSPNAAKEVLTNKVEK